MDVRVYQLPQLIAWSHTCLIMTRVHVDVTAPHTKGINFIVQTIQTENGTPLLAHAVTRMNL